MRIVGLDLSLCNSGVAVAVDGTISWDVLSPPKGVMDIPRLDWIAKTVGGRCEGADLVVLEDFAFGAKGGAIFQLGGMGFMVRHQLWRMGLPYIPISPGTLKKFVTGSGTAQKNVMLREVWRRWKHEASDDNSADAIGLCYIGLALVGSWLPTIDPQREVVRAFTKKYAAILEPWRGRVPAGSAPLPDNVEKF
jgi:crossover junction endodeoxyribonuclease RuvC